MFGFKLLGLVLSSLIAVTPISNLTGDTILFPQTRDVSIEWHVNVEVYDLGYTTQVTAGSYIHEETAKHNYLIMMNVLMRCNQACYFAPTSHGYTLEDGTLVATRYTIPKNKTAAELTTLLSGFNQNGNVSGSYTFTDEDDYTSLTVSTTLPNNVTFNETLYFPAVTQGTELKTLDDHFYVWSTMWEEWKDLDLQHKANELQYYMYQMRHNGTPMTSQVQSVVDQLIEQQQYDAAYTVINNYYYDQTETTNQETESIIDNYDDKNSSLDTLTTQEQDFADQIESDFTQQIGNISTQNITESSDFQRSAFWVTDKFNRMTNNNAFGSLLGFSLLIGFAMAIIGRVLK